MATNSSEFSQYHQILFWPLEIFPEQEPKLDESDLWKPVEPLNRETDLDPQMAYQEFVYFHPFAQQFLYPERGSNTLLIHRRTDVGRVRVEFFNAPEEVLDVDRVHLYRFFPQRLAILVVEVSAKRRISREAVLLLEDRLRRIYPPHWERAGSDLKPEWEAGHCPKSVEWLDRHGAPIAKEAKSNYADVESFLEAARKGEIPVCSHWEWLLRPFNRYRQIEDDRAASMVFLSHETPASISRGDLVRHCFYDGPGSADGLPYSPEFLANFEQEYGYRRFWDPTPGTRMKTSYTCCGYGFTVITEPGFWGDLLLGHFRHHYFQLGLLAHFHRASLLRFSKEFTQVMQGERDTKQHYVRLLAARKEFGEFISTSWFHEVSNQEQGRELFELWTRHLRSEKLMENILTEATAVDAILNAYEQRRLQREEDERNTRSIQLAQNVDRLTVLLYIAAAATLIVALLDTELVKDLIRNLPPSEKGNPPWFWKYSALWASALALLMAWIYRNLNPSRDKRRNLNLSRLCWALVLFLTITLAICVLDKFPGGL